MPQSGEIYGKYRLSRQLGKGGFAEVWLGENQLMLNEAAIKILLLPLPTVEEQEKFLNEARHLASLSHPNIVRVLDCDLKGNTPFLVLEYAPNGTLRARHPRGIRLPLDLVVDYVKQVAAGLQYAHNRRLVHRDIKPENMLIGRNNQILISDFGIASVEKTSSFRMTKPPEEIVGTPGYMAPEQFDGIPATAASDQYSLSVVVFEWLSGSLPFQGKPEEIRAQQHQKLQRLRDKVPGISPAVEQVVLTALSEDRNARYRDIQTFADALVQAAGNPNRPQIPVPQNNPSPVANPLPQINAWAVPTSNAQANAAAVPPPLNNPRPAQGPIAQNNPSPLPPNIPWPTPTRIPQNNPTAAAVPPPLNNPRDQKQGGVVNNSPPFGAPQSPPASPQVPGSTNNNPALSPNPWPQTPPQVPGSMTNNPALSPNPWPQTPPQPSSSMNINPAPSPIPGTSLPPFPGPGQTSPAPSPNQWPAQNPTQSPLVLPAISGAINPLAFMPPTSQFSGNSPLSSTDIYNGATQRANSPPDFPPIGQPQEQTRAPKRGLKLFDWRKVFSPKNNLFLLGGGLLDFALAVVLGIAFKDPHVWFFCLIGAWALRYLCAASTNRYLAIPLAVMLVLYWWLGTWAAGIQLNITIFPPDIISFLVLILASVTHGVYAVKNKKK